MHQHQEQVYFHLTDPPYLTQRRTRFRPSVLSRASDPNGDKQCSYRFMPFSQRDNRSVFPMIWRIDHGPFLNQPEKLWIIGLRGGGRLVHLYKRCLHRPGTHTEQVPLLGRYGRTHAQGRADFQDPGPNGPCQPFEDLADLTQVIKVVNQPTHLISGYEADGTIGNLESRVTCRTPNPIYPI